MTLAFDKGQVSFLLCRNLFYVNGFKKICIELVENVLNRACHVNIEKAIMGECSDDFPGVIVK